MTYSRFLARYAALLLGIVVASSCDTRLPTQPSGNTDDVERPQVRFSLSSGTSNTADLASPLVVTVTATDNKGVSSILTTARNGALVTAFDSVKITPAARSAVRAVTVPLAGSARGDKIVVRSTVIDVGMNVRVDSVIITVGDSIPPSVSVVSTKSGRTLKGGDTVDVKVTASDSAGIAYAGYRLLRINATDSTIIKSDSVFTAAGVRTTNFTTPVFTFVLPSSLLTGPYTIVGFAADRSAMPSRLSTSAIITIVDGQRPTIAFQAPTKTGRVMPGDSILVRARLTDNIGLARVTFRGVSLRGTASLGTADTVVRYPLVTVPSATVTFATGTRDTTVQRYLKVQTPVDTLLDSLVVFGIVTDAAGNADTSRVTIGLVPPLSLTTSKPAAAVKNGDAIAVTIVAGDTSAVNYAGYRVYRVRATDSVLVRSDSVAAPSGTTTFRPAPFNYVVPDTLSTGTFTFVAFARTSLGLVTRPASGQGFTLGDATRPAIQLLAPTTSSRVRVGDSILVRARVTDNIALARVSFRGVSFRGTATLGMADTVVRYPTVTVPGATLAFAGATRDTTVQRYLKVQAPVDTLLDSLVVVGIVTDAAGNADTTRVTVGLVPALSLTTNKPAAAVKNGDAIAVAVVAGDTSAVNYAGYRVYRVRATDSLLVRSDSVAAPTGTTTFRPAPFNYVVPDTLSTGSFTFVAFARTSIGLVTRPASGQGFTVGDATRPAILLLAPTTFGRVRVGDSILVRARITDNIGLARVSFRGVSLRGTATLGTADTVVRYPTVTVPGASLSFTGATRDTTVQRYLKVQTPVDTLLDSLVVFGIVTDAAGNADTTRVTIGLVPMLSLTTNKPAAAVKNGDAIAVTVVAGDTAAVNYAGYRVYRVRSTDSLLVRSDSMAAPPGTTTFRPAPFTYVIPDTLSSGSFTFVAFARTSIGLVTRPASGQGFILGDFTKPAIQLLAPLVGTTLNVGDSVLVTARITDNIQLFGVTFTGTSTRGSASLGTQTTVRRLSTVTVPPTGGFRSGLRDTTVSRYLTVILPIDTTTDTLVVSGVVTDAVGLTDSARVSLKFVNGPAITINTPQPGDSAGAGINLQVRLTATHGSGIARLGFRIRGDASWPTPLNDSASTTFSPAAKPGTFEAAFLIPANAPPRSFVTITPFAVSGDGVQSIGSPLAIPIRTAGSRGPVPRVVQRVAPRSEISDSVTISASGSGITAVGYELTDASRTVVKRDSVTYTAPYSSAQLATLSFNLSTAQQGKRLAVISFAYDQAGQIGYSVPTLTSPPQSVRDSAFVDSTLIVFGRTYSLPAARRDVVADLVVDPDTTRANVFLSNKNNGRLEVWSPLTRTFAANGIVVGSQPWGMTVARTGARDTLYVANSGGTNLSRVFIGSTDPSVMKEDLAKRIVTRASYLYKVTEVRDETGKIRISLTGPFIFSDRPQYVEQSAAGRLYVSTRPTSVNPAGTIRFLDPSARFPDYRFILDFASAGGDAGAFLVANVDSMKVFPASANTNLPDVLEICDHDPGTNSPSVCARSDSGVLVGIARLRTTLPTTDVESRQNADEKSLALTDTTYATSSGDGKWIAFGEGNKTPIGRAFLLRDDGSVPKRFTYAAPNITIADLTTNAADVVFGLALDSLGSRLGVHGNATYFAKVDQPFTARLQGTKTTFSRGAGIAFFPGVDSLLTVPQDKRLAFVASANGTIEAIDIAYYDYNRGSLATKANLYGPLRAAHPTSSDNTGLLPSDPNYIRVKLYGLTAAGLVVIDVRNRDIVAGP